MHYLRLPFNSISTDNLSKTLADFRYRKKKTPTKKCSGKSRTNPAAMTISNHWKRFDDLLTLSQTTNFRLVQTERVCRRQFQIC